MSDKIYVLCAAHGLEKVHRAAPLADLPTAYWGGVKRKQEVMVYNFHIENKLF